MLINNVKNLFKHTSIYSIGWIASSLSSILLLPVYTRFLTRGDYGILEIIFHTNGVLKIILLSGFNFSIAKFYHDQIDENKKKAVISTAIITVSLLSFIAILPCLICQDSIAIMLLGNSSYSSYINIGLLILLVELLFFVFLSRYLVEKQSIIYVVLNLIKLVTGIVVNVICIVCLNLGAMGMLYGNLASFVVVMCISGFLCLRDVGLSIDFKLLAKMLKFGLPMIPASLFATLMHNADRFLIRKYCSISDVGIYGMGYQFPMMLNLLILGSFSYIWSSATIYEIAKERDSSFQFGRITTYFLTIFVFLQFVLSISSTSVLKILAAPDFFEAHQVIPLISLGLCFHASYLFFTTGAFVKEKTWLLGFAYCPPAIINIVCNVALLPKYGYMGAAVATALTYFIFAVSCYISCRSSLKIDFEFKRLAFLFITAFFLYLLYSTMYFDVLLLDLSMQILFIIVFILVLLFSGFLTQGEKMIFGEKYKAFKLRIQSITR